MHSESSWSIGTTIGSSTGDSNKSKVEKFIGIWPKVLTVAGEVVKAVAGQNFSRVLAVTAATQVMLDTRLPEAYKGSALSPCAGPPVLDGVSGPAGRREGERGGAYASSCYLGF